MRNYETIFLLSPELAAEAVSEQQNFYSENITKNGGEIIQLEPWGKRALAYRIGNFNEGYYTLIQFKADSGYIPELERRYKYNELILRYAVIMLDEKKFKLKPRKDPVKRERKQLKKEDDSIPFMEDGEADIE